MVDLSSSKKHKQHSVRHGRNGGNNHEQNTKSMKSPDPVKFTKDVTLKFPNKKRHDEYDRSNNSSLPVLSEYQSHNNLLIQLDEDSPTWFQYGHQYNERDATISTNTPSHDGEKNTPAMISKYRALSDMIYQREAQLFGKSNNDSSSSTSDTRWVESTMKKGTLKDRIAAMNVVLSSDPIHKFYVLDNLLQMMGCNTSSKNASSTTTNSRVAQLAAEAAEDLFLHTLLPPDRKLLTLANRPLYLYESRKIESINQHEENNEQGQETKKRKNKNTKNKQNTKQTLSPRILLLWRFEEMVKEKYEIFLRQYIQKTLQDSSSNSMEIQKIAALRSAATFLRSVPEGENLLLQIITNKLGDPNKKVSSAAGHELRKVLVQHPAMTAIIAREVQQLAHRPNLSSKALYNCIIFLNQLKLSIDDNSDENKGKTNNNNNVSSPSLPASLISTYFRLFEVAVQQQEQNLKSSSSSSSKKKDASSSEAGMKSRLLSALLTGVNRAHPYLPEKDKDMEEHIDQLYRVVHTAPPAACTQSLLLLFHLVIGSDDTTNKHHQHTSNNKKRVSSSSYAEEATARKERFYRALYSTLSHPEMIGSGKHLTMYFNLLYKAMKYDTVTSRLVAFAKKLSSFTIHSSSAVTAASLFLLNEVCKSHPILLSCYEEIMNGTDVIRELDPSKREPRGALVVSAANGKAPDDDNDDDEKRAPGWELSLILHHFHPSVQLFANQIGKEISYTGDPLKDFTLAPFLDKFAYRNPKSVERVASKFKRGESVAERKSGTDGIIQSQFSLPVNDPSFLEKGEKDVQDEFFHKFFLERAKRDAFKGIAKEKVATKDEMDAVNDDEEEKMGDKNDGEFDWETDSEEEAFVDSLALKIMEDSCGDLGPDELDDEDPYMDDWDDLKDGADTADDSDEEAYDSRKKFESKENDAAGAENDSVDFDEVDEDDIDAFMEDEDDESSDNDSNPQFLDEEDEFMDSAKIANESDDSGSDQQKTQSKKTKKLDMPTFASAEDYQELISKSWKRARDVSSKERDEMKVKNSDRKKKKR